MSCNGHEWVVFSTCLGTIELMVECANCGAFGTVANPTKEEWNAGFYASSKPYRWFEDKRVTIRSGANNERHIKRAE